MSNVRPRFHLAFPVNDLDAAKQFYAGVLGCSKGRESSHWVDFNFYGHQIVAHLCVEESTTKNSEVDGDEVPVRHFGVTLEWGDWQVLRDRLENARAHFIIAPKIRFVGEAGEQATMFIRDPSGNALEFKSFRDDAQVFANESAARS